MATYLKSLSHQKVSAMVPLNKLSQKEINHVQHKVKKNDTTFLIHNSGVKRI